MEESTKLVLHASRSTTTCKPVVDALGGESAVGSASLDLCSEPGFALEVSKWNLISCERD